MHPVVHLPGKRISRVHINMHHLRENRNSGSSLPIFTIKRSDRNRYSYSVAFRSWAGDLLGHLRHRDSPGLSQTWLDVYAPLCLIDQGKEEESVSLFSNDPPIQVRVLGKQIAINRDSGTRHPVLELRQGESVWRGHEVIVGSPATGQLRLVYRPDEPLSCGARVWIETHLPLDLEGEFSFDAVCELA